MGVNGGKGHGFWEGRETVGRRGAVGQSVSGGFDVGARKAKEMAFFGHHLCYLCSLPTFVLFTYLFRSPLLPPSARPQVMVCTDRASRGVDFGGSSAPVGRVVLFDWPRDPAEFLRRVGRTARAGVAGACVALVVGKQVHAPSLEAAERRVLSAACRLPRAEAWECVCVCVEGGCSPPHVSREAFTFPRR